MILNSINLRGRGLYIDFDNTLIVNPYDVDLTGDLDMFFKTFGALKTEVCNNELINWLKDREFTIFTNRGDEGRDKVLSHLSDIGMAQNLKGMVMCAGKKMDYLSAMSPNERAGIYFIDNAPKYKPDVLVSGQSLTIINY